MTITSYQTDIVSSDHRFVKAFQCGSALFRISYCAACAKVFTIYRISVYRLIPHSFIDIYFGTHLMTMMIAWNTAIWQI